MTVIPPYLRPGDVVFRVKPRLDNVDAEDHVTVIPGAVTGGGDIYALVKWGFKNTPSRENQFHISYLPRSEAAALQQYAQHCDATLSSLREQIVHVERLRTEALALLSKDKP